MAIWYLTREPKKYIGEKVVSYSWGYTQKTVTQVTPEAPTHPCLLQHYSQ
jgi:hypothetical protein